MKPAWLIEDGEAVAGPLSAPVAAKKTQTTRYRKTCCTVCTWTARVTAKHLDHGTLRCPVGDCEGTLEQAA